MEKANEIQNLLEHIPSHVIAVLIELGELYKNTNPYWNTEDMSKFAKDNASSVLAFWEKELEMNAPVSCSKIVSMWYEKTSTTQKLRQDFMNILSGTFISNNFDTLEHLLNQATMNVTNIHESFEKLEEIYQDNAKKMAELNLEKLKGLHHLNSFEWNNDVHHLNLQQKAIEELFSCYSKNDKELTTPSLEAARLVKKEAVKQMSKRITEMDEGELGNVWVELLKESEYTLVGRLASNATDADTDSDVWYLIEKGEDDEPIHVGDYNHYNDAILAFKNLSKLNGFLK